MTKPHEMTEPREMTETHAVTEHSRALAEAPLQ